MLSIVVPVFNEDEGIRLFFDELYKELKKLNMPYEILFVDDGSTDTTLTKLQAIEKSDKSTRVFSFRKNQGKAEALTLGFQKARGKIIVTLDADLQDLPSEIHPLLTKLDEGWDAVSGWRKDRKHSMKLVMASKLFNSLGRTFWGLKLHDYNCGLKVYRSEAAKSLRLYGGLHRFIPLLLAEKGFTVSELPVKHQERQFGTPKYGFSKVFKDLPDIFTMLFLGRYSKRPMHFFGLTGGVLALVGTMILLYLSVIWAMGESIGGRPLLIFGMLTFLAGMQVFFTGFLAELLTNLTQREYKPFSLQYESDQQK